MKRCSLRHHRQGFLPQLGQAFTLIEVMVGVAILSVMLLILTQILSTTQSIWVRSRARAEQYQQSQQAFETMVRRISQATLNSYLGYRYDANGTPTIYQRESELHFVSGPSSVLLPDMRNATGHALFFQAPMGFTTSELGKGGNTNISIGGSNAALPPDVERMDDLLNGWGYYITYTSDLDFRPQFLRNDTERNPERKRFRLMEYRLPTEQLTTFTLLPNPAGGSELPLPWIGQQATQKQLYSWFTSNIDTNSQPIADNILAVLIQPITPTTKVGSITIPLAPDYLYDTRHFQWSLSADAATAAERHQLPPEIRLTLVALDEASMERLPPRIADEVSQDLLELLSNKLFQKDSDFGEDLLTLTQRLTISHLEYRVFSTAFPIRAARWANSQN
jgi:uncharacterized protein (TIGR02599 family)